jgi:hypothetical protein
MRRRRRRCRRNGRPGVPPLYLTSGPAHDPPTIDEVIAGAIQCIRDGKSCGRYDALEDWYKDELLKCDVCRGPLHKGLLNVGVCSAGCASRSDPETREAYLQLLVGGEIEFTKAGPKECEICGSRVPTNEEISKGLRKFARLGFCSRRCAVEAGWAEPVSQPEPAAGQGPPCVVCGKKIRRPAQVSTGLRPYVYAGFCSRECAADAGYVQAYEGSFTRQELKPTKQRLKVAAGVKTSRLEMHTLSAKRASLLWQLRAGQIDSPETEQAIEREILALDDQLVEAREQYQKAKTKLAVTPNISETSALRLLGWGVLGLGVAAVAISAWRAA